MTCGIGSPAFGSSVRRTLGSPFSGYRGDYTVYPDEPWRLSLRKYPYPTTRVQSPMRHARSVSPRRKATNVKAAVNRWVLEEILGKLDSTQEDLHSLAQKVAAWSREAASLSEGLKEEALLLELGRQANRLAASEAQHRELHKRERVYRLGMENSELRRELRELIRVVKLLLDRSALDREAELERAAERAAAAVAAERAAAERQRAAERAQERARDRERARALGLVPSPGPSPTRSRRRREAWVEDEEGEQTAVERERRRANRRRGGGSAAIPAADVPYYTASYASAAAPPPPAAMVVGSGGGHTRRHSHSGGPEIDAAAVEANLEGLADENAPYFVAADRAKAEVDADPNRRAPWRHGPVRAAAAADIASGGGGSGGTRNEREVAAQAALFEREMARDRQQVGVALAAVDEALQELTLNIHSRASGGGASGSASVGGRASGGGDSTVTSSRPGGGAAQRSNSGGAAAAPAASEAAWPSSTFLEPLSSMPSFGGFLRPEGPEAADGATPSMPEAWRRQQEKHREAEQEEQEQEWRRQQRERDAREAEVQRVRRQLAAAEAELAAAVAEQQAAEAAEAAAAAATAAVAAARAKEIDREDEEAATAAEVEANVRESPAVGTLVGTPVKLAEGVPVPVPAPPTPVYQGVPYGYGGAGGARSAVRHGAAETRYNLSYKRAFGGGLPAAVPLDSVLLTEVEKLKRINKALASTLHSYNRVANRLDDAAAAAVESPPPAAAAGAGGARATFGDGGLSLAAVAPPLMPVDLQLANSVAATYGRSSASSAVPDGYAPSYPPAAAARALAAPSTPPPAACHLRQDEHHVSWVPSTALAPRARLYDAGGGGILAGEAGRLDAVLDHQLYGIRHQLQALRQEMVNDRLVALAASAPGGGGAATADVAAIATDGGTAAMAPSTPHREVTKMERLEEEVSELRRQVEHDRRWYRNSLGVVVSERSAAFADLQRRIDRLMTSAI